MDEAGRELDGEPSRQTSTDGLEGRPATINAKVKVTRRPNGRHRRFAFLTKKRLKDLAAPFDTPGAELAEIPVIGHIVIAVMLLVAVIVIGILLGGFVIALAELLALGALALLGTLWAWIRGHPKVSVVDVDGQRWARADGPSLTVSEDERLINQGTPPSELGYQLVY